MVNLTSLQERYELIDGLYREHLDQTLEVQADAIAVLVPQLAAEIDASNAIERALAFLDDPVTVFRFLRKAHFDPLLASELLRKTLTWRLTSSLDLYVESADHWRLLPSKK
jgi:hypothetical protein